MTNIIFHSVREKIPFFHHIVTRSLVEYYLHIAKCIWWKNGFQNSGKFNLYWREIISKVKIYHCMMDIVLLVESISILLFRSIIWILSSTRRTWLVEKYNCTNWIRKHEVLQLWMIPECWASNHIQLFAYYCNSIVTKVSVSIVPVMATPSFDCSTLEFFVHTTAIQYMQFPSAQELQKSSPIVFVCFLVSSQQRFSQIAGFFWVFLVARTRCQQIRENLVHGCR